MLIYKRKLWTAFYIVIILALYITQSQSQQLQVPRLSQGAKISQTVGLSEISVSYHRPGVKGREIWGKLVPYNEIWRTGANEPTLVTLSDDAMIEGKKIAAGIYRLVTIPTPKEWTVVFNTETKNWGTIYNAKYDSIRFKVIPETGPHEEWMSFSFTDLTPNSARLVLAWEKLRIGFKIEFNTLSKLQASIGKWEVLNEAARFSLDNKIYLNEAMTWIDRSIALDKNYFNLRTKAELLARSGKYSEAITTAEEAIRIGKAKDQKLDTSIVEKLIADWKLKK
ncbi:MAG: DUF2911 domain-containing protein [Bacteroidota bacterium]